MSKEKRIWEIDFLRGVAIICMVTFHLIFDLAVYYGKNIHYMSGFWFYLGRFSAILFMLIAGISATFSSDNIKRGLIVFGSAMIVTIVSLPVMGENYIRFGILHFFGAAMILKGFIEKIITTEKSRIIFYIIMLPVSFLIGNLVKNRSTSLPFLFPVGLVTVSFSSFDYYPIFPWICFFIIGILIGMTVYKNKQSLFSFAISKNPVSFMGRHSLLIYLLHQPVLQAVLFIVYRVL